MSITSGLFEIRIGGPSSDLEARLEWVEGVPVLTSLSSAGKVRVNSIPLAAGMPYFLQHGDRITIGDFLLTWTAAGEVATPVEAPQPLAVEVVPEAQATRLDAPSDAPAEEPALNATAPVKVATPKPVAEPEQALAPEPIPTAPARVASKKQAHRVPIQPALIIKTAQGTKEVPLTGEIIRLGRAVDNDIPIDDKLVSRYHAQLLRRGEDYEIIDLGSVNGLSFESARISKRLLANGDVITISKGVTLTYVGPVSEAEQEKQSQQTLLAPAKPTEAAEQLIPAASASPAPPVEAATMLAAGPASLPSEAAPEKPADVPTERAEEHTLVKAKPAVPQPASAEVEKTPATVMAAPKPELTDGETAFVDMADVLASSFEQKYVPAVAPRDTEVPHLIIYLPENTWEVDFTKDMLTIGRTEDNDIQIRDDSISRQHATIEQRGQGYIIRDVNSRNGVFIGKQRIEQHRLRDGDVITLGRARLIFKGGFKLDDLTLIGTPRIDGKPARRPVVFVPGFGGSELWLGSEKLWPSPKIMVQNPDLFKFPGDPRIEARGIVGDVVVIPGILKQEQYRRLGDYMESGLGYTRGKDFFEFAYDWRQDIRSNSKLLGQAIENWGIHQPVTIIAHSLGTLVTRYYVEKLGGKDKAERIILMGGPHYGTPRALATITVGPGILPFGFGDERMRQVLATFPSSYQILPIYPCVFDQNGKQIDVLEDPTWVLEAQRPLQELARSFRKELGEFSSVPTVSIFGYGVKTTLRFKVTRRPDGTWSKIEPQEELGGDGTIPAGSAVVQNSEIHPVMQEHGSLYVDNDVKMRLKVELTRSTSVQRRK